jgi:hypothetical protein
VPIAAEDLQTEVGTVADDTTVLERCVEVAEALLSKYVADNQDNDPHGIPEAVYDQAWLAVAVNEFNRRKAPNGILNQSVDTVDGSTTVPMRVSSDSLRPARALLSMWCTEQAFGFA